MSKLEITCAIVDPLNALPRALDELRRGGHQIRQMSLTDALDGRYHLSLEVDFREGAPATAVQSKISGILDLTGMADPLACRTVSNGASR